jgi:gluconolactonase
MRNRDFGILTTCGAVAALFLMISLISVAQTPQAPPASAATPMPVIAPSIPAVYVVNLATLEGMTAFNARWKNMDVKIVEAPPMPNAGEAWKSSYDITPKAGDANFDDSSWPAIEPKGLLERRGGGHLFMTWFRTTLTVPAKIGEFDTNGATAVLTFTIDDYAEAWVNGQMPRRVGRPSPATIQGFNMPNRVVLAEQVKAGDKFQIAILGINGPISLAPPNPVFFREAKIEFFR